MNKVLRSSFIAAGVSLLLIAGCGVESAGMNGPGALISLAVQPSGPSLAPGTTLQLQAVGRYENNGEANLTTAASWESADPGVATVSGAGLAAAASAGTSVITARVGAVSGSATVTSSEPQLISVSSAAPVIAAGTSVSLFATATLENGATQDITAFVSWDSSNAGVATVDNSGRASASPAVTGITTITAALGATTGSTELSSEAVVSLAVTPANATLPLGTVQQFTATAALSGGATQDITSFATWTSSAPAVAIVDPQGLLTSAGAGAALITATFAGVSSSPAALNVSPAVLTSISVDPVRSRIAVGQTSQFIATGSFSDGTSRDITADASWVSRNSRVAAVSNSPESKGLATALDRGTTAISANFSGIFSNAALLTVTAPVVESITVSPVNPGMVFGATLQFTAEGTLSDGTRQDLTSAVTWSSSDISVAAVSDAPPAKGFVTSFGVGTATITAVSEGVSGSSTVTVTFF